MEVDKLAVGVVQWHNGPVAQRLNGQRGGVNLNPALPLRLCASAPLRH